MNYEKNDHYCTMTFLLIAAIACMILNIMGVYYNSIGQYKTTQASSWYNILP